MKKVLLSLAAVTAIVGAAAPAAAQTYHWNSRGDYQRSYTRHDARALGERADRIAAKVTKAVNDRRMRPADANRLMADLNRIMYSRYSNRETLVQLQRLGDRYDQIVRSTRYSYGYGSSYDRRW